MLTAPSTRSNLYSPSKSTKFVKSSKMRLFTLRLYIDLFQCALSAVLIELGDFLFCLAISTSPRLHNNQRRYSNDPSISLSHIPSEPLFESHHIIPFTPKKRVFSKVSHNSKMSSDPFLYNPLGEHDNKPPLLST